MKSFLSKKKAPPEPVASNAEAFLALSGPPEPSPVSPGLKKSASRWKRSKKQVEVKPQIDVTVALPSNDDFRTSLMMPSFSARFSMLREQDDPYSILGKASDDSVLQPRRRSRMDFGGLGDIAEVASIKNEVRPPFTWGRQDSFASEDGYGSETDSTSMMSRARPGEGNTLFGGRQKVYMIPKAGAASTRSLGKVRYEDDIGMSAFQRYKRELERNPHAQRERTSDESNSFDFGLERMGRGFDYDAHAQTPNDSAKDLSHSPSLSSYERKRSTASTSHSEAPSSTVATSVASQPTTSVPTTFAQSTPPSATNTGPLKRADTKTRRLYEQGLDQHIHEQQASAMTRLNSIQRQQSRAGGKQSPPVLHSTKSAGNLHDKARQPVYALRSQSPEVFLNNFGSIRKPASNTSSPNLSGPVSPLTPHDLDADGSAALTQALEPGDRGKATAMGAFNKPNSAFDEQQYLERQRQLQRSASNAAGKKQAAPVLPAQRAGRFDFERERSDSDASARSASRSASATKSNEPSSAYNVFQRAAQINTTPGAQQFDKSNLPDTHRTFFGNISASDSEDEEDESRRHPQQSYGQQDYGYGYHPGRWQPTPLPSVSEHPALRGYKSQPSLVEEDEEAESMTTAPSAAAVQPTLSQRTVDNADLDLESPVLGNSIGATPLAGMMHHLRQASNVSSITQAEDKTAQREVPGLPDWNPKNLDLIYGNQKPAITTYESDSRIGSTYTSSNPFDLEERDNPSRLDQRESRASISPIEGHRPFGPFDSRAPSTSTFLDRQSAVSQLTPEVEEEISWQNELQRQHTRDASTATQQEREAFQNELEARRNNASENIMQRINQSRNASPARSAATSGSGPGFRGFGMLRSRPSGESVNDASRQQAPTKAMKMLGLNGGSTANPQGSQLERGGYSLDINRARDFSASRPPLPDNPSVPGEWQYPTRSRENSESRAGGQIQPGRSPASSTGTRSRANSEAAGGGSRSRTGPYRDDLEKAMIEGTSSRAAGSPAIGHELTPRPSPDVMQGAFEPRARSNSRPPVTGYFDSKGLQPVQTGSRDRLGPGAPSPVTLSPNTYSPNPASARIPTSHFASNMTPPLSGSNTPSSAVFTPPTAPSSAPPTTTSRSNHPLRKKTISKGDISEPTLIMSTSNIDTIDLPEGASLKNGMDEAGPPPPLPPINPRRRATKAIFGLGHRKDSNGGGDDTTNNSPPSTSHYGSSSKTPDPWIGSRPAEPDYGFEPPTSVFPARANGAPETRSPRMPTGKQSLDYGHGGSPGLRQNAFVAPSDGSPERMFRASPAPPQQQVHHPHSVAMDLEGGMF